MLFRDMDDVLGGTVGSASTHLIFLAALVFLAGLLSFFFGGRISQPIGRFCEAARRIGAGQLDVAIEVAAPDEISDLARSFNAMATNLKTSRAALQQERDYVESLFDTAQCILVVLDTEGRIVRYNQYMEQLSGHPLAKTKGSDWFSTFLPDCDRDGIREVFRKSIADVRAQGVVNPILTKDGRELLIEWNDKTLKDAAGAITGILAVGQNITERKQMEERLRQSEKMQAIGQLAGGIAHNLNNQLAPVLGYADMLASKLSDEKLKTYAERIVTGGRRSAQMVQQILAFARRGILDAMVPLNAHETIAEVADLLDRSIDKRIHMYQRLQATPPTVSGDPGQLQSVIFNLALNAVDAMPQEGDLTFTTEVVDLDSAFCEQAPFNPSPGRFLKIAVTDTGGGMSPETQKHMFEPFFTTKGVGKGTGMGLASVYGSVERHKGTLAVQSTLGEGSTFALYLPSIEEIERRDATPITKPSSGEETARIFLVDDEEAVRDLAADMLRDLGHEIMTAGDGREAIACYKTSWQDVDLVLLDMIMPEMNGRDTFFAMRAINPDVKVILCTGYDLNPEAQELLDAGALAFVHKPFEQAELSEKVAEALRGGDGDSGKEA